MYFCSYWLNATILPDYMNVILSSNKKKKWLHYAGRAHNTHTSPFAWPFEHGIPKFLTKFEKVQHYGSKAAFLHGSNHSNIFVESQIGDQEGTFLIGVYTSPYTTLKWNQHTATQYSSTIKNWTLTCSENDAPEPPTYLLQNSSNSTL